MQDSLLEGINALLITNPTNIRYLTGFVGVEPEERESYLLITKSKAYLFTNSLYFEQAKNLTLFQCYIDTLLKTKHKTEAVEISRERPIGEKLAEILRRLNLAPVQGSTFKGVRLGFEEEDLTVAEFGMLKKELKGIILVPTKNRIEELRMIKREDEIENIKQAAQLTDTCFDVILTKIKSGITEEEIAREIESFFRRRGAEIAFSPIVAFGKNSSQPHYVPKRSDPAKQGLTLKKNEIVLLDFGAMVNGYCSDMTRVVFIGKPKKEWIRAYEIVLKSQLAALDYLKLRAQDLQSKGPGLGLKHGGEADQIARSIIKQSGFPPYPHSLGHGVGLDIHEQPRLTVQKDAVLKPGMVITVEPGIYIEGRYGIRIEDLVLLKEDGIEILSKAPKDILIL